MESGLSCIAVNLPSLYFLFSKVTPENVLRSVRSMISLASIRSGGYHNKSVNPQEGYSGVGKSHSATSSSQLHLARPDAGIVETHAMYEFESTSKKRSMEIDNVQIIQSISQRSDYIE
jgi:hypothetical protein